MPRFTHSLTAIAVLAAVTAGNAHAASGFPDVPAKHWAAKAVQYVTFDHPYMNGVNGRFEGNKPMDRLAFAKTMANVLPELEKQSKGSWADSTRGHFHFGDVPAGDRLPLEQLANVYNCFSGLPGLTQTTLGANRPLTRAEMAHVINLMLARAEQRHLMAKDLRNPPVDFTDVTPKTWATDDIMSLSNHYQVIDGFPDGTFKPASVLTRYQFAAAAAKIFPKVHALIDRAGPRPSRKPLEAPTPAPTPEPSLAPLAPELHTRYLEDAPLQITGIAIPAGVAGGRLRGVLYSGPLYAQAEAAYRTGNFFHEGQLRLGSAVKIGDTFAYQPFMAAMGYTSVGYTNPAEHDVLGGGGLLLQARPWRWLGLTAMGEAGIPLWSTNTAPNYTVYYETMLGAQLYFMEHGAVTLDLGYGLVPMPSSSMALLQGNDPRIELGLAFGF